VGSGLCRAQHLARHNSKNQRSSNRKQQSRSNGHSHLWRSAYWTAVSRGLALRCRERQA
jgi:hypothetical protein